MLSVGFEVDCTHAKYQSLYSAFCFALTNNAKTIERFMCIRINLTLRMLIVSNKSVLT